MTVIIIGGGGGYTGGSAGLGGSGGVRSMEMRSFSDSMMGSWWVVTLDLPEACYHADGRFAKELGQANVEVVHKPLM